jgi:hypothetical protein
VVLLILSMTAAGFSAGAQSGPFRFEEKPGEFLMLYEGEQPVLQYNSGMQLKEGAPKEMRRSSYIHPLWGLEGRVLTDDFPRDHYHHRGVFWAWAQVKVGDTTYDPWGVSGMMTKFERWLERRNSPLFATFGVHNGWYVGDEKVVDEKVSIQLWRANAAGRAIDFNLTLEATAKPVVITGRPPEKSYPAGKGYGGFGVRFAPHTTASITTIEGRAQADVVRDKSPYADYSARFGDAKTTEGIAVFADKSHPGFPPGWLLRHYGYIGLTWPGIESYTLERGKPLNLRYRLWVHKGDFTTGRVKEAYGNYVAPAEE